MVVLVVTAWPGAPAVALAAPEVSLQAAADGTLKVIGNGWRPGQQLVISVGGDEFAARADSAGDFEIATGLASYQGDVAVHRPELRPQTSPRSASLAEPYVPNPLAVLFAQSVAIGTVLTLIAGGLTSVALAARSRRLRG
jgi:hypothetical protein